jgi:hypothetical protein
VHRAALGITPGELAVLVVSTFGSDGLLGRHGLGPVDELLAAPGIRVVLTVHPHVWAGRHDHLASPGRLLASRAWRGLIMWGPDRDWVPFLAAADAAVIDHSCLGLYYELLARATVAVPVRDRAVNPAAPVKAAVGRFDPSAFAACRRGLTAYPGQAAARTTSVLYELLGRPVPGYHLPPGAP